MRDKNLPGEFLRRGTVTPESEPAEISRPKRAHGSNRSSAGAAALYTVGLDHNAIAANGSTAFQNPLAASPLIFPIVECSGRDHHPGGFSSAQLGDAKSDARRARRRY